jgi:hypothetical protein
MWQVRKVFVAYLCCSDLVINGNQLSGSIPSTLELLTALR